MKNEEKFNKLFSAFVLIGMTVALVLTTALKLGDSTGGKILLLVSAFGSLLGSVTLYFILAHFDKSAAGTFLKWSVILDVITLVCNILGQLFMSNAYMEQWFFWIGVNIFSILMWSWTISQTGGSYALIYIIKYSFYLINSIYGLRIWLALSRKEA